MKTTSNILLIVAMGALMFLFGYNFGLVKSCSQSWRTDIPATIIQRDTLRITDTIREPVPVSVATVRVDSIFLPGDTIYLPVESKKYVQTISNDTVSGSISVSLSGYDANLDSLSYSLSFIKEREIIRQRKRWGWNITAGPGLMYDPIKNRISPSVGLTIGFGYNF